MTAAVRLKYGSGGGGMALLGDRVTSQRDDEDVDGVEMHSGALLDVLTQVKHAYMCLLQSNNYFYPGHGTIVSYLQIYTTVLLIS